MAEETSEQVTQMAQTLFNKGFATFERGNLDIAIELLLRCVEISPGFLRARRFLRSAELQKARKSPRSAFSGKIGELMTFPAYLKTVTLLKSGKAEQALFEAEKLLKNDPLQRRFAYLLAEAAEAAGQMEAATMTLEFMVEAQPDDIDLVRHLGDAYMLAGEYGKARDCYNKVIAARPTDSTVLKLLKDAEARHSMKSGGWEESAGKEGGYRDLMNNKEQAEKLDIQAKAQAGASDAETMIADTKAKIAAEPRNLNYYRALARMYLQQKRFAEGIQILEQARALNAADPELDRTLTSARLQEYTARIEELRVKGDAAAVEKLEQERDQFVFDDLVARVERYPNDLRLRLELGIQYYDYTQYDDAIQQLQLAQRNPRDRNDALFYLARCFRAKKQSDMAIMQLDTALEQLPIMDENRKKVLFELGELSEEGGDVEKAFNCYREVYGADIGYRDVGEKMERIYKLRQQQAKAP